MRKFRSYVISLVSNFHSSFPSFYLAYLITCIFHMDAISTQLNSNQLIPYPVSTSAAKQTFAQPIATIETKTKKKRANKRNQSNWKGTKKKNVNYDYVQIGYFIPCAALRHPFSNWILVLMLLLMCVAILFAIKSFRFGVELRSYIIFRGNSVRVCKLPNGWRTACGSCKQCIFIWASCLRAALCTVHLSGWWYFCLPIRYISIAIEIEIEIEIMLLRL